MAHVRGFASVLFGLVVIVVLAGIGVGIYDAGVQQGIAQTASVPAGTLPYAAYGYGFHGGFGFLGLLFPLFFLFLIFGIARMAFRGGRGGWGHGYGRGYGKWGPGPGGPGMGGSDRETWVADWHRRLHEDGGSTPPTGPGATGSPGSSGSGPANPAG
jgi:hypothetical protein